MTMLPRAIGKPKANERSQKPVRVAASSRPAKPASVSQAASWLYCDTSIRLGYNMRRRLDVAARGDLHAVIPTSLPDTQDFVIKLGNRRGIRRLLELLHGSL